MPARPPAGGDSPVPADVVDTVPGNRVGLILVPIRDRLGQSLRRRIDCEVVVESIPAGVTGRPGPESVLLPGESRRSAGVALLRAQAWTEGQWKERPVLLWAQVGFLYTIRGVASNVRENPSNIMALIFLAVVALLFVLVEILTLGLVTAMGRSILRALNSLRQGTARLRSGNLRYRIPIEGRDDLWDVAESFNQMAEDLSRARELEIEKERMEGELAIARSIQSRLLPAESPTFPRADLAGLSLPAREVGGDYYDVLKLSDHEVGLIVADVSGKGVGAALLMSSFRAALLSQDLRVHGPAVTMQRINGFLHRSIEPGRFVTAFLCVLDVGRGRISYANAGHNQPLLVRATGEISMLREGGLVLGMFGDTPYRQVDIDVDPGDLLVLYTDGLTEAVNEEEEFYGEERLIDCLRRHPQVSCRDALRSIMTEVRAFTEGTGLPDDLTVLLARWRGADPGKLSSELPYEAERRASHVGRI